MADRENCVPRLTRAAGAVSAEASGPPAKRKRLPLSKLPTLSNATILRATPDLGHPVVTKPRLRSKRKEAELVGSKRAASNGDSEADDPQLCGHYASDIYQYLRSVEVEPKRRPLATSMEMVQNDVTAHMRGILVDWLVDKADEHKLQLLGVSSMLIASKYEEISPPHVEDFVYITDKRLHKARGGEDGD